mgnify:CR=1 FL=1
MKKFTAALLASTCIVGTAYAQEVPFSFHPGAGINASTVSVAGPVTHFVNIQPITTFAYTMCVGFGSLQ